ncbi:hypothetical protein B1H26_41370 [Amycolatopsis sp. BJA-103]|nr:hypothetical protein B1H26_41370 [Amycolatopsis sp. BJA-103]
MYGVLVPPAPEQFWFTNRKGVTKPREISELGHNQADAHHLVRDYFSVPHVIARLGEMLRTLAWLHRKDIVLGDLHRANVLVGGLANVPAAYVIDCDAVVFKGEPALRRTNFPYPWSHPMPTWPDPLDKSCDLAFFAHMTVGLVSKRLENIALTDDVLCHFPVAHGELLAQWLRRENAAARADTLSTVAVQWCRYVSDQGIEYVRSGTSEQRKPWKGVAAIPASPTGDIKLPKPLNPVKPTDRRLSPQLTQKSVLAEQVPTKRPCLGVAMIKVHFANTLCELATVFITVVMTAS